MDQDKSRESDKGRWNGTIPKSAAAPKLSSATDEFHEINKKLDEILAALVGNREGE